MRLPDEVQKCVVFLGRRQEVDGGGVKFKPEGTGFLVKGPSTGIYDFDMTFLVTAKHVARRIAPDFDVRFNLKGGKADYVEVYGSRWFEHPSDNSVDAVVMPWAPPAEADCLYVGHGMFVDGAKMAGKRIGVGDEVYATGLFSPAIGFKRNTPIVRSGHLAMSPPEEVAIRNWDTPTMRAFLIEMRSLGGLSGSPVFVQRSIKVEKAEHSGREPLAAGAIFLLGLMHGHWNVRRLDLDYVSPPTNDKEDDLLNAGIAIVTPAESISTILAQKELQDLMAKAEHQAQVEHPNYLDGGSPLMVRAGKVEPLRIAVSASAHSLASSGYVVTDDSIPAKPARSTKADNPSHKEDFNRLLGAAATTPKSDD